MTDRATTLVPLAIVVWLAALAAVLSLVPSCGASPRQTRLAVIEATAVAVGAAGDAVTLAATADAESSCPIPQVDMAGCLGPVRLRWAPADEVLEALRLGLGGWLVAESLDGGASFADHLGEIVGLWQGLSDLLAGRGINLPPLAGE